MSINRLISTRQLVFTSNTIFLSIFLGVFVFISTHAQARWRHTNNNYQTFTNTRPAAPRVDYLEGVKFDYSSINRCTLSPNSLQVRLSIDSKSHIDTRKKLYAEVTYFPVKHSTNEKTTKVPLIEDGKGGYTFSLNGLEPSSIYRLRKVTLHGLDEGDSVTNYGEIYHEYVSITGEDPRLEKNKKDEAVLRRNLVLDALAEQGEWAQNPIFEVDKSYSKTGMEDGGWCGRFVHHIIHGKIKPTTYDEEPWYPLHYFAKHNNLLSQESFYTPSVQGFPPYYVEGSPNGLTHSFSQLAKSNWVHGDYANRFYQGSKHVGLILGYDEDTGKVWTVEGRHYQTYPENGTMMSKTGVAVDNREVSYFTRIGHITDEMILPPYRQSLRREESACNTSRLESLASTSPPQGEQPPISLRSIQNTRSSTSVPSATITDPSKRSLPRTLYSVAPPSLNPSIIPIPTQPSNKTTYVSIKSPEPPIEIEATKKPIQEETRSTQPPSRKSVQIIQTPQRRTYRRVLFPRLRQRWGRR